MDDQIQSLPAKPRKKKHKQKSKPEPVRDLSTIQIKLDELRSCSTTAAVMTRQNYVTMLKYCPPELFEKIIKRLFLAAVSDPSGQAAFAALQYLVGKPPSVNMDRNAVLEDMRAVVRLHASKNDVLDEDSSSHS